MLSFPVFARISTRMQPETIRYSNTLIRFNFASQLFEKFRVDLISRMSLKTAENGNFGHKWVVLTGLLHPNCDFENFAWI